MVTKPERVKKPGCCQLPGAAARRSRPRARASPSAAARRRVPMPWRRWSGATRRRSISAVVPAWCRRRWPARLPSSPRQARERGRGEPRVWWVAASRAAVVSATRAASSAIWTRPTGWAWAGRSAPARRRSLADPEGVDGGGDQEDEEPAEGPGGGGEVGAEGVAGGKDLRGEGGKGGCGEDVAPRAAGCAEEAREEERRAGEEEDQRHRVSARRCGPPSRWSRSRRRRGRFPRARRSRPRRCGRRVRGPSARCACRGRW